MTEPVQVEAHGAKVWADEEMDALRRERCLCLRCAKMPEPPDLGCHAARAMYSVCADMDVALAVTRCKGWQPIGGNHAG